MVRQGRKAARSLAPAPEDMLNFHFSSSPSSQQSQGQRNSGQKKQPYRRSDKNRSSARRKAASSMFYLHSSADHAFVITRISKQGYSFSGPDDAVQWDRVRAVTYLVPSTVASDTNEASMESCPICLDTFTCPRITKCGHCFCLPCLLRHVHTVTATHATAGVKCPCCGLPIHVDDLRPATLESVQPPKVQKHIKLVKLHRVKACPSPYLPQRSQSKHSSPHAAPLTTDSDAPFSRFRYVDPPALQAQLHSDQEGLEKMMRELRGDTDGMQSFFVQMSMERVNGELRQSLVELEEEEALAERYSQTQSGMYETIPEILFATPRSDSNEVASLQFDLDQDNHALRQRYRGSSIGSESETSFGDRACHTPDQRYRGGSIGSESEASHGFIERRYRGGSIGSESEASSGLKQRYRGGSMGSESDVQPKFSPSSQGFKDDSAEANHPPENTDQQQKKARKLPVLPASAYLEDGNSQFYQSEDGQLCFLSKFNMSCLTAEFSTLPPDNRADMENPDAHQYRRALPLPDVIEGPVLEVEHIHLTHEIRKRMPFLSHLPLHIDIVFVELDLRRILSDETKNRFRGEFEKRRRRRKNKKEAEKRADKAIKLKEMERLNELKSRIQRIDPNDAFFQGISPSLLAGEDFGPTIAESQNQPTSQASNPAVSFSAVLSTPSSVAMTQEAFPSLGASVPSEPEGNRIPGLGQGWHATNNSSKSMEGVDGALPVPTPQRTAPRGKKSKGKKIVLLSTGGHRGNN